VRLDQEEKARAEAAELRNWLDARPEPGAQADDGELEIKQAPSKERYGATEVGEDAGETPTPLRTDEPPRPALSYGRVPETYIRGEEAEDPDEPGVGGSTYPQPDPVELGKPQNPKQRAPVSASLW
jgi:hypothetical protein